MKRYNVEDNLLGMVDEGSGIGRIGYTLGRDGRARYIPDDTLGLSGLYADYGCARRDSASRAVFRFIADSLTEYARDRADWPAA